MWFVSMLFRRPRRGRASVACAFCCGSIPRPRAAPVSGAGSAAAEQRCDFRGRFPAPASLCGRGRPQPVRFRTAVRLEPQPKGVCVRLRVEKTRGPEGLVGARAWLGDRQPAYLGTAVCPRRAVALATHSRSTILSSCRRLRVRHPPAGNRAGMPELRSFQPPVMFHGRRLTLDVPAQTYRVRSLCCLL